MRWQDELMRSANDIMIKGGELRFTVIVRDRQRIPMIYVYLDNKVVCNTETLID